MNNTRKLALAAPVQAALSVVTALAFVMAVATGICLTHAVRGTDLPLAEALMKTHYVAGFVFMALCTAYGCVNWHSWVALFSAAPVKWRQDATQRVLSLFVMAFVAVAVSALLVLCGVRQAVAFHTGTGLFFSVVAVFYIALQCGRRQS